MKEAASEFLAQMQSLFNDGQSYIQVMKEMQDSIEEPKTKKQKLENSFVGTLMDFQVEGLKFLYNSYLCGMNCILADDMGLGKTIQCLALCAKLYDANALGRVLILCPSAVVYNWVSEMEKFVPNLPCYMHYGNKEERHANLQSLSKECIIITSYQVYMNDFQLFNKQRYQICIIDEAHRLKNSKCKLASLMEGLLVDDRILLTGTPLQNDIIELWSLLKFCLPNIFDHSFLVFEEWMLKIKTTNTKEKSDLLLKMKKIIEPHMLRRTKAEVFPDMLMKKSYIVNCPKTKHQKILYDAAALSGDALRQEILNYVGPLQTASNQIKTAFSRIRVSNHPMREMKICCHPFLYAALDIKRPFSLFEASGKFCVLFQLLTQLWSTKTNKIIIFTQFVDIISIIAEECDNRQWNYALLHGSTSLQDREEEINNFQNDKDTRLFIATTRSGGLGLNLTAANHVILYDLDW